MRWLLIAFLLNSVFSCISVNKEFYPEGPWISEITDEHYICKTNEGKEYRLDPKTVSIIKIITNDKGPFEEDVFYKLEGPDLSCYLPQAADPNGDFLEMLQSLKGFNNKAVMKAMTSTENKVFIIWDRDNL